MTAITDPGDTGVPPRQRPLLRLAGIGLGISAGWLATSSLPPVYAAVLISLLRTGLPGPEQLFIGWFGPRGIGTVVLGLLVIERGDIRFEDLISTVVVVTVTLSLLLHSLSTAPGIARLASARVPDVGPRD